MIAEDIYAALAQSPMERLKWLVLREFGVLPGSKKALELSEADFVICGANMVLDRRRALGRAAFESGQNEGFDLSVFKELGGCGDE